jgi:hypothetical protein
MLLFDLQAQNDKLQLEKGKSKKPKVSHLTGCLGV